MTAEDAHSVLALVTTEWLAAHGHERNVRVADVRWYLPHIGKQGRDEYARAHIPGAVFVDLDSDLAAPRGSGPGRHPLPPAAVFATAMERAGIVDETHVVAYDDAGGAIAARLWWLLRYFGHGHVSVLDGGITRWIAEDRPLGTGSTPSSQGPAAPGRPFAPRPRTEWVVDRRDVAALLGRSDAVLLDARAPERYEGRVEPVDARAGHIPGARSAPFAANLRDDCFRDPAELHEQFAQLGVDRAKEVVAYCGSGVTACHDLLALHLAGVAGAKLYEGSWSDWSSDSSLPIATGPA